MSTVRVVVSIVSPADRREVELAAGPDWALLKLLEVLFRDHALSPAFRWQFDLPADQRHLVTVGELFARAGSVEPLRLSLVAQADLDASGAPGASAGRPQPSLDDSGMSISFEAKADEAGDLDGDLDGDLNDDEFDEGLPPRELGPERRREDETPAPQKRKSDAPRDWRAMPTGKAKMGGAKRLAERRATVRYYTRMNPDRMFPLLVILSKEEVAEVVKARVKQAASEAFQVEEGSVVEVEPVLPGCDCYPPRHALTVAADGTTSATVWVVPRVLGRVHGARVLIRQGAQVLAEVPLDVKVAKQTLAVACGLMSLAAPYLTMGLKSLKLDYESQKADGFPLYQQAGGWVADHLRPEWIGLGFLGLALALYLWMRPRKRDVFWDINPK